uniref:Uncharacterized protein n=1 Tax=Setaria digitata TaxID=48799 RepID=A0A915PW79_9BILA
MDGKKEFSSQEEHPLVRGREQEDRLLAMLAQHITSEGGRERKPCCGGALRSYLLALCMHCGWKCPDPSPLLAVQCTCATNATTVTASSTAQAPAPAALSVIWINSAAAGSPYREAYPFASCSLPFP